MCFSLTSTLHHTSLVTDSIARHYECLQAHENEELLKHYFTVETQDRSNKSGRVWVLQKHIKEVENLERSLWQFSIFLASVSLQLTAYIQDVHVFSVYIIRVFEGEVRYPSLDPVEGPSHSVFWRWFLGANVCAFEWPYQGGWLYSCWKGELCFYGWL